MSTGEDEEPPIIEGEPRDEPIGEDILDIPFALDEFLIEDKDGDLRVEVDVDGKRHTVDAREPLQFEERLAADLITPSPESDRFGANVPIKGRWINGWLNTQGEDYINNIWHNWQFFLKFLEGRSKIVQNSGTIQRSPGTYDSMYRYLMILEDLDAIERHKRTPIPPGEFDFPIPEEFRVRTFVRIKNGIDEKPDAWRNPYTAMYGEPEDDEEVEIPEEPDEIEEPKPPDEEEEVEDDEDEETDGDDEEAPEQIINISQFEDKDGLIRFIVENFRPAIEKTFDEAPVPTRGIESDDFKFSRVGIFGPWADSRGEVGETTLNMIIAIDASEASNTPPFIPAGTSNNLEMLLNRNNEFEDTFPSYEVDGVYDGGFKNTIEDAVEATQQEDMYYDLGDMEFVEV